MANITHQQQRHTKEMEAIIDKAPSWIINWGITTLLFILILIGIASSTIKYPETINVKLETDQDLHGKISIPLYEVNKVKPGQITLVKLDNFPSDDYGILKGRVRNIETHNGNFISIIDFDPAAIALMKTPFKLTRGLTGKAKIIIGNTTLSARAEAIISEMTSNK